MTVAGVPGLETDAFRFSSLLTEEPEVAIPSLAVVLLTDTVRTVRLL